MAVDGSLIFNTKIDTSKFNKEINGINKKVSESGNKVQQILADTERSAKSKAASIAAEYKKQGMSQSEAMKTAWAQIERDSSSATESIKGSNESIGDTASDTADSVMNSSDMISMAVKAGIAVFQEMEKVAKKVAKAVGETIATVAVKVAQGIGYASEQVGKFTLKQFIGDWESESDGLKQLLIQAASIFSLYKIFDFGKESIQLGSDLNEVQNVVDVTFTNMSDKVNKWSQDAAEAYGLSETMAKKYVGLFGSMADAFGFTEQQAYDMSTTLAGLSGDVASFYNISQDEAYTKLKSVFSGETETLKDLGIVMTQNALDSYALANGYGKTTSAMTEQEKVALRYKFVLDQLQNATGDFTRTQASWANQTRILSLCWQSLQATVGKALINVFTPALTLLNEVLARLQDIASWFEQFVTAIFGDASGSTGAAIEDLATADNAAADLADNANNAADAVDSIADAAADLKDNLASFDELNVMDGTQDGTSASQNLANVVADAVLATGAINDAVDTALQNAADSVAMFQLDKELINAIKKGDWYKVAKIIATKIKTALRKIPWKEVQKGAVDIATNIANFINGAIDGMPWDEVGQALANGFNTAILFLATLLEKINWGTLGEDIAIGLNNLIDTFDAEEYGTMVADKINAMFEFLGGFAFKFNWDGLGNEIGQTLASYFSTLHITEKDKNGHTIPETIAKIINGLVQAGIDLFTYKDPETGENIWGHIGKQLGLGLQEFLNNFEAKNAVKLIKDGVGAFVKLIYNIFKNVDFIKLGKETADGLNEWFADKEWWKEIGGMINEISNDICDFFIAVIMGINTDDLGDAIYNMASQIEFENIFGKLWLIIQTALLKTITVGIRSLPFGDLLGNYWGDFLRASTIGKMYGEDYVNNILGLSKSSHGSSGGFGSEIGSKIANDTAESYNLTLQGNSQSMSDSTANVMTTALDNTGKAINKNSSVKNAMSSTGTDGQTALTANFKQTEITGHFSDVWSGIQSVFSNVSTWFSDTFGTAWNTVKGIFSDGSGIDKIKQSVENVFKKVLNDFIDGLNNVISFPLNTLNSMIDNLRNFSFGGPKYFDWLPKIPVPQIPRLATGTVVPASYGEFLAVLGDNKRETEVVSPLSTIKQALAEALSENGGAGGGDINITLTLDNDVIAKHTVKWNDKYIRTHGKSAFST